MRLRVAFVRLRELFHGARLDWDLSDEVQSHLDMLTDEYIRQGCSRDDARRRARRDFGGIAQVQERVRGRRGVPVLEQLLTDIKHAVRQLHKARGFTLVAVVTLALGIGVNAAIFSVVDAVVLRPLPYPGADRLVSIWEAHLGGEPLDGSASGSLISGGEDPGRITVAPADFVEFQERSRAFAGMAGVATVSMTLTGAGAPEQLLGEEVTPGYCDVLGAAPARGRGLTGSDSGPAAVPVVVISDALWHGRFGAAVDLIGRTITLDDRPRQVVGVMPPGFTGVSQYGSSSPLAFWVAAYYPPELLANHADHEIDVVARLAPGVSLKAAQTSIASISDDIARRFPDASGTLHTFVRPLGDDVVREVKSSLFVLLAMVGLILLMACVNVANLIIVRGVGRRREVAIRYALGAARRRVLSGLVVEGLLLAGLACTVGLVVAWWAKDVIVSLAPQNLPRLGSVGIDTRVIGASVAVALLTGVLFGALPAWQARRSRPVDALKGGERAVAAAWMLRWRRALMTAEIALSAMLLIAAGLAAKSLYTLTRVDVGFRTDHVLAMNVNLPVRRYPTGADRFAFFDRLQQRLAALPGVRAVGFANRFPMRGGWESGVQIDGLDLPGDGFVSFGFQAISPGYFDVLGLRLVAGRLLTAADRQNAEPVALVSEAFSRTYLNGASAIGRRMRRAVEFPWITIVGVVADVRRDGQRADLMPQVYLPAAQTGLYPVRLADVAVLTAADTSALVPAMRDAVRAVDPDQPVANVRTLEEVLAIGARDQWFQAMLLAMFAALALTLAVVGTYGVVSYAVTQRTPEIGVRLALGADNGRILRWLLGDAARLIGLGAALGLAAALALSHSMTTLLFDVRPTDPVVYVLVLSVLGGVAILASYVAARRAIRISPVEALRSE